MPSRKPISSQTLRYSGFFTGAIAVVILFTLLSIGFSTLNPTSGKVQSTLVPMGENSDMQMGENTAQSAQPPIHNSTHDENAGSDSVSDVPEIAMQAAHSPLPDANRPLDNGGGNPNVPAYITAITPNNPQTQSSGQSGFTIITTSGSAVDNNSTSSEVNGATNSPATVAPASNNSTQNETPPNHLPATSIATTPTSVPDPYLTVDNPSNGAVITDDVITELQNNGTAQVTIYLRDAQSLQSLQSAAEIAETQDALLLAFRAGAFQLDGEFSEIPQLVGEISPEALTTLTTHPTVAAVRLDYPTVIHGLDDASLQLIAADKVQAGTSTLSPYNGDGIVVAVLDTGMDTVHPDLIDNVLMQGSNKVQYCAADDCWDGNHDTNGHGTHVSGIVANIAPNVKILPIRVFNRDGSGKTSYWTKALEWVLKNHALYGIDVVSMSLGTSSAYSAACDVDFNGAYDLVTKLVNAGIPVFASTGNNNNQDVVSAPACLQPVIAVSSVYQPPMPTTGYEAKDFDAIYGNCYPAEPTDISIPCYASTGYQTDLLAPGIVNSTWLHWKDGGTKTLYGTSQSAPMAAAVAALMLQAKPNLLPIQIEEILESTGQKILDQRSTQPDKTGSYIFPNQYSYPLIDAEKAVEEALKVKFECRNVKNLEKSECDALVAFYSAATTGGAWTNGSGWLQDLNPCTWYGIECTTDGKHLTAIRLPGNGLTGTLSAQIAALSQLQVLDVSFNALGSEFPGDITKLPLNELNVSYNKLHFRTLSEIQINFMRSNAELGWDDTQTVPPTNAGTNASSTTNFSIFFAPINYPTATGYYEAGCGFNPAGPYNVLTQSFAGVSNPVATFIKMDFATSVQAEKTYYCIAKFITTAPHALTSDATDVITVSTKSADVRNQTRYFASTEDTSQDTNYHDAGFLGGNTNFAGLFVGDYTNPTFGEDYDDSRAYLKFGTLNVPNGALIESISLRLCYYASNGAGTFSIHHATSAWQEFGVTTNNRPGYSGNYRQSGGNFQFNFTGDDRCIEIPLNTTIINNLQYGMVIRSDEGVVICSRHISGACTNGNSPPDGNPPYLKVSYKINTGPGVATNPSPADGAVDQPLNMILGWDNPVDSQGDAIKADVFFGTNPASLDLIANDVSVSQVDLSAIIPPQTPLVPATNYYWYVDTIDTNGSTTFGETWQFTTDVCPSITEISSGDCAALKAVFKALNGAAWQTYTGWFQNTLPCSWAGIQCRAGGANGYQNIVGLSLVGEPQLSGNLADILPLLKQFYLLETLNISNNPDLTGSITADIKWLPWLQTLNLSGTGLQGKLPIELNLLTKLQTLDLHNTGIGFDVPLLANLSALRVLDLSDTEITALPPNIGALLSLQTLKVNQTRIVSPIPADLGNLTQLQTLDMSYAGFYGAIPSTLTQLVNIITANLNYNALHIPTDTALLNWLAVANAYDAGTQTLAVTDFVFDPAQMPVDPAVSEENSLTFTWNAIPGVANPNLDATYSLQCAGDGATGQYVSKLKLLKTAIVGTATELFQASNYWCKLVTTTNPNSQQKNTLTAETNFIKQTTAGTVKIGSPTNPEEITSIPYMVVFDTVELLWIRDYPDTPIPECLKNNTGDNGNGWRGTFQFTYGTGSTLKIKVEGSDGTAAGVAIFEADDLAGAIAVLCNKNAGATGTTAFANPDQTALVDYQTKPGQKFIIMVVETSGNDGQITLSITDSTYRGCDRIGQAWQTSCQVLYDLYYDTGGPNWHRAEHWMQTSDLCAWEGVICDAARTKIIGLDLAFNNIIGRIPESLGNLITLENLNLAYNNLEGEIPASFLNLVALQSADLRYNRLSAMLPELITFLNAIAPGWELQTVPPTFFAKRVAPDRIELVVNSIADSNTLGHYQVFYRALGEANWQRISTRNKTTSTLYINELKPDQVYEFYANTISLKTHSLHMRLESSSSPILSVMTLTPPLCDPTKITGTLNDLGTIGTLKYSGQQACLYPVGLAIYEKNGPALSDQVLFNSATPTLKFLPNQAHTVTVTPPTCAYQADLFIGEVIRRFDGVYYDNGTTDRLLAFEHKNGDDFCHLPAGRILAVELFDITTGATIRELRYGDTLDLRQLPPKFNIRARVAEGGLGSVRFDDGTGFRPARNAPPYVYIGGQGRYWQPLLGIFTLQVMPHSLLDGRGRAGAGVLLRLNIINSDGAGSELPPDPNTPIGLPPVIAPVPPQTDFEAILTALRLMVRADGIVRWQVTGLPPGIELEEATGLLIGRPTAGSARPAPYQVTVRALDAAGQAADPIMFDWYIQPVPQCRLEDLTATISKDGTIGTITGKNLVPCHRKVGIASYEKHDNNQDNHTIYDSENPDHIFMPGEPLVMTIEVPECLAQVNIFEGEAIQPVFGTQRYGTRLIGISQHPYSVNGSCTGRVTEIALQLPNNNSLHSVQDGDVIDIADIGTWNANLIAQTHPMTVGSVFFQYTASPLTAIANTVPYIFPSSQLQLGRFTLTATAYSGADGSGRAGVPHVVTFTVVNTNQTPQIVNLTNVVLETGEDVTVNLRDFIADDDTTLRCSIAADGDASLLLPSGLSINDNQCTIIGVPQTAGDWLIPLRVVDSINPPVNFSLSVTVITPVDAIAAPVAIEPPFMAITPEPENTVDPAAPVVQPPSEATAEVTSESIIPQEVQMTDEPLPVAPLPEATSEAANQ
jgi:Leucine-rich repeat (LRR) protein